LASRNIMTQLRLELRARNGCVRRLDEGRRCAGNTQDNKDKRYAIRCK
jgi:hypothetical protein